MNLYNTKQGTHLRHLAVAKNENRILGKASQYVWWQFHDLGSPGSNFMCLQHTRPPCFARYSEDRGGKLLIVLLISL
ncbi:hypothetical protein PGTUg99_014742 [Puccinia graminis f. sp. tritici]|uniref:Uncharacterized protein n=1 Tax=Puccinia graminis f. sp. tritici TaxID=56615 RepID=A0A5B0PIC3_PUCGR|nr:hypothetical protein PGTUg99_014742 [Puccinia graminis f. sp. tritici]